MPQAKLLSRDLLSTHSLKTIVEKSQVRKPPFQEFELRLNSTQLDIIPVSKANQFIKPLSQDEGFESDIDTVSLVSSDDSFASSTCLVADHALKHRENDSALGSASSDSDNELPPQKKLSNESYSIIDVLCYTDVKFPNVLVFCIKEEVLVFSFESTEPLQQFYTSFSTLKAVTNQRTYGKTLGAKFNLLHRTDNNGMTHIEISREPNARLILAEDCNESSNIISINTPEVFKIDSRSKQIDKKGNEVEVKSMVFDVKKAETLRFAKNTNRLDALKLKSFDDSRVMLQNELKTSRSEFFPSSNVNSFTLKPKSRFGLEKELAGAEKKDEESLKKVWKSAEDLLDAPRRPERRRKPKGKAPLPPVAQEPKQNVMKGQFVRVAVDPKKAPDKPVPMEPEPNLQTFSTNVQTFTPNWNAMRSPKSPLVLTTSAKYTPKPYPKMPDYKPPEVLQPRAAPNWTNSVPRLLKKPRSRSETRHNTPMAYRYIDTTKHSNPFSTTSGAISNRLFGLSQKLKEFSTNVVNASPRNLNYYEAAESRRSSLCEMTYKMHNETSLKSVIKKQDDKRSTKGNEQKKVTFSAYATVQVV